MSSSDLPACPACGCRRVHVVKDPPRTFYACMECGRDQTSAWEAVQPESRPEPAPVIGEPEPADQATPADPQQLGIGATVKP